MAVAQAISFTAADGETIRGTCFSPENVPELPLVTIINAGAGIPASYYNRFADCLADRGIVTVTYDYRGIGKSRPVTIARVSSDDKRLGGVRCACRSLLGT